MMTISGFDLDDDGAGMPLEWRGMQLSPPELPQGRRRCLPHRGSVS